MVTLITENSTSSLELYRYDNIKYDEGDIIKPPVRKYDQYLIEKYRESTGIEDVSSVVYLLENENDTYLESCDYEYLVEASGEVFKGVMDYSPEMCSYHEGWLISKGRGTSSLKDFISLMSKAYKGNVESMNELKRNFEYSGSSDTYEYISTHVKVVKVLRG